MKIDIQEKPNDCPKECEICGHPFDANNRHFIIKNKIGITIYICEDCLRKLVGHNYELFE